MIGLVDFICVLDSKLWFIISKLFWSVHAKLVEGRPDFLQNPGVDFVEFRSTLVLDALEEPYSHGIVVKPTASLQCCYDDFGLWDEIHFGQIIHSFATFPLVDFLTAKVIHVLLIELFIGQLGLAMRESLLDGNWRSDGTLKDSTSNSTV